MNKYLEKDDGEWNYPYVSSDILRIHVSGYAPKYRGGCIAIIPNGDMFLLMGEDDDHYFDECNLSNKDFILSKIKFNCFNSFTVIFE